MLNPNPNYGGSRLDRSWQPGQLGHCNPLLLTSQAVVKAAQAYLDGFHVRVFSPKWEHGTFVPFVPEVFED